MEVLTTLNGAKGEITDWEVQDHLADLSGDLTTTNGYELFNVNCGQLPFLEFSTDNPIDVLAFTWQGQRARQLRSRVHDEHACRRAVGRPVT